MQNNPMRNFVQEYNELTDDIRSGKIDVLGMSDEGIEELMRREFRLKWLASKQSTEIIAADTARQKAELELRQEILIEEMKKAGYSGDLKGTQEDWVKFFTDAYGEIPAFYGLKSKNDKLMKDVSFKKEWTKKLAASRVTSDEHQIIQFLYDTKIIKLENSPRYHELPESKNEAQK